MVNALARSVHKDRKRGDGCSAHIQYIKVRRTRNTHYSCYRGAWTGDRIRRGTSKV